MRRRSSVRVTVERDSLPAKGIDDEWKEVTRRVGLEKAYARQRAIKREFPANVSLLHISNDSVEYIYFQPRQAHDIADSG